MQQLHAFVTGRVQGVFFRDTTEKKAKELGLTGWVRNTSDGRVEVLAQGGRKELQKLLDFLEEGSSAANVDDVDHQFTDGDEQYEEFSVRYV